MSIRYHCKNKKRAQTLRDSSVELNGIDYLEVLDLEAPADSPRQRTLLLRMLKSSPWGLSRQDVRIDGGVRIVGIKVEWVLRASEANDDLVSSGVITAAERDFLLQLPQADEVLVVRTDAAGDYSNYTLHLVASSTNAEPPAGFDPILSGVDFSFKVECPSEFDCEDEKICPSEQVEDAALNYLAKDYASFRKLMLDRLSITMPEWQERSPADIGIAMVEVMANAADYLSYYQDAVGTEAYLGTARRRTSVRRHVRLLDYPMHEGCNARAWVQFQVTGERVLPQRTQLFTRVTGEGARITPDSMAYDQAVNQQPIIFETMHQAILRQGQNRMRFYAWGDEDCCLPIGTTSATLAGHLADLAPGDVLIFVEERGVESGSKVDAELAHRHAVRLTDVILTQDPLGGQIVDPANTEPVAVTEISWMAEDALPFALCISQVNVPEDELQDDEEPEQPVSVALGNVVLADHGRSIDGEMVPPASGHRRYRPKLQQTNISFTVDYDHDLSTGHAATLTVDQDPRRALPAILLDGEGSSWAPRRDLLGSGRNATEFVVENENDGQAYLRFGDGTFGRPPHVGETLLANYRVGNGIAGNIGADALCHVVTSEDITSVRNPLSARGGIEPESLERVRLDAPQAFRSQQRAITEEDYATVAQRHPEVQKATATRRWTGSWHTMFLTVDRKGGLSVDAIFETELRQFLERFRLAGQDLEIDGPHFVALELAFKVCVEANHYRSQVKEALLEVFSNDDLADGRRGFFHPDNFTFGQPVYLSKIVAAAMQVPGVKWIDVADNPPNLFKRWREVNRGEFERGQIDMGRLEIARMDNDPSQPENGKLDFIMEGGI